MFRLLRATLIPVFAAALFVFPAQAAEVEWTGASDDNWENAANWSPEEVPTAADSVVFGRSSTDNPTVNLAESHYSLLGISFLGGEGFVLMGQEIPTITLTGGVLSSHSETDSLNLIFGNVVMTAASNTITVSGESFHELEVDDLSVTGSLLTNVESSLCLAGVTTVTGAFVKSGIGQTCTAGGLTAASTSVEEGLFMVEGNSSLGTTVISAAGTMTVMFSATAAVQSVAVSGVLGVGICAGSDDRLIAADGVAVEAGGTLAGAGTVEGDLIVKAGGQVVPGGIICGSPLTIIGNAEFQTDSIVSFTLTDEEFTVGSLSLQGNLVLNGLLSLNDQAAPGLFTLIEFTGTFSGGFAGIENAPDGYFYDLIYNPNSVQLAVTAVPEPSVMGLMGLAALSAGWAWRRRLKSLS